MHCISLAILSRFPSLAVGFNWPFCVDVPLNNQPTNICHFSTSRPVVVDESMIQSAGHIGTTTNCSIYDNRLSKFVVLLTLVPFCQNFDQGEVYAPLRSVSKLVLTFKYYQLSHWTIF